MKFSNPLTAENRRENCSGPQSVINNLNTLRLFASSPHPSALIKNSGNTSEK
jgi:hypothetical protein